MKRFLILTSFLMLSLVTQAQIEHVEYFSDTTAGKLNMIHHTIKVDDGIIISGEMNENGYEHPVILKIDLTGQVVWSTLNTTKIGVNNYQNGCIDFTIDLFSDGFIYGVYHQNNLGTNLRKFWKVNPANGQVIWINTFYSNGFTSISLTDYSATKYIACFYKSQSGQENVSTMAYISKATGDTLKTFNMGVCSWDHGTVVDHNKNIYYWKDQTITKYNRDSIALPIWSKTYSVYNSNTVSSIHSAYIDYQDNLFLHGRTGGTYGYGNALLLKISNQTGNQIWNTLITTVTDSRKSDLIDRNGKLYISYRHELVGGFQSSFKVVKLDKETGVLNWHSTNNVVAIGTPNGSTSDKDAVLSMDIDCNGDLYLTGYYNDANYGPENWGNMKINGNTGAKIYDQTEDLTPSIQDNFSTGKGSFIFDNKSIVLGQLENLNSPNFLLSDAYYSAYDISGNNTALQRIGAEFSIPSQTLDFKTSGDTLYVLKQRGRLIQLQAYLHDSTLIWNKYIQGNTNRMPVGGLLKINGNALVLVYKENISTTTFPYALSVSDRIQLMKMNRSNGTISGLATLYFTTSNVQLLEFETDNTAGYLAYERNNITYMTRWDGASFFSTPITTDLASSVSSFAGYQNCIVHKNANELLAVDNGSIKQLLKSNLSATTLFTFPNAREYYDLEYLNNKLYLVGKNQQNQQLFTVYNLTTNSLIVDDVFDYGAFLQLDLDPSGNAIVSGNSGDTLIAKYINLQYNSVVWEKAYTLGTTDSKRLYGTSINPFKNVLNQTGTILRADGSNDLFINTINFSGDTLFSHIEEDQALLKSFGYVTGYAPDSSSLVGGTHNRHIASREGVIFDINASSCKRVISGGQTTCATPLPTLTASAALSYQWTLNGVPIAGAITASYVTTVPGRYNCIFTDVCGQDTSLVSIYADTSTFQAAPLINSSDTTICPNSTLALISSPSFHYQWLMNGNLIPNSNNDTLWITQPGSYSVIVMNSIGCSTQSLTNKSISLLPGISNQVVSSTYQICSPLTGIMVSQPQLNYQWLYNGNPIPGATNDTLLFNNAGTYNVIVGNLSGCTDTLNTSVVVNSYPSMTNIFGNSNSICHETSQYLVASPSQNYQWYQNGQLIPGEINDSLLVSDAGNFNVHVFNPLGCLDSASTTFAVSILPFNHSIASTNNYLCNGQNITLSTTSGQNAYEWLLNGVSIPGIQSTLTASQAGYYNVKITDQFGCIDTLDNGIALLNAPIINSSFGTNQPTVCSNSLATIVASTGAAYQWLLNGSPIVGQTNDTLQTHLTGDFSVLVTDQYGCIDQPDSLITISHFASTIGILGTTQICNGNQTNLSSTAAQSYQWFFNGNELVGEVSQILTTSLSGNYTLTVIDTNGCIDSTGTAFTLSYFPSVTTISGSANSICNETSHYLVASPSTSYQWYQNGQLLLGETNDSLLVSTAGNYNAQVTNTSGCLDSATTAFTVSILPFNHSIAASNNYLCNGQNVMLSTTSGQNSYEWLLNGATIPGSLSSLSVSQDGYYNVKITDQFGCTDTLDTGLVLLNAPIVNSTFSASQTTVCSNSLATIVASTGNAYQWLHNGSPLFGQTNDTLHTNLTGDFSVIVTDQYGCTDQTDSLITISHFVTTIGINGNTQLCEGSSTTLTSNPALDYQWYYNGNPLLGEVYQTVAVNLAGNYSLSITDLNGCYDTLIQNWGITYFPNNLVISSTNQSFCQGLSETLSATTAQSYQWYQNGSPINGENSNTLNVQTSGVYNVMITDFNGCIDSASIAVIIEVFVPQTVVFGNMDNQLCINDAPEPLIATPLNGTFSGTGVAMGSFDPNVSQIGVFEIVYSGNDVNNCFFEDTIVFTVIDTTSSSLQVDTVGSYTLNGITYTQSGTYTQFLTNSNGCDSILTLIIHFDMSSLNELETASLIVYPNPSNSGFFTIQSSIELSELIKIFDAQGRKVLEFIPNSTTYLLDLSQFERGEYILEINEQHFNVIYH